MGQNPQPAHITAGMWWFIEEWERMEPATVFAGAWGEKPGYHCDAYGLWWHKDKSGVYSWRGDYSLQLVDDKVLGTPLEQFGAAVDITFPDAQGGNYARIRKYSDRVKAAWAARDPRLRGWREVLCNCSDNDSAADGFDIPGHYERTPDDTHKWHIHFSCQRKFLNDLTVWQAMISVLKGETLAQWLAGGAGGEDNVKLFKSGGIYWVSRNDGRDGRETVQDFNGDRGGAYGKLVYAYSSGVVGSRDDNGWPKDDLAALGWSEADLDQAFGRKVPWGSSAGPVASSGGGGGVTMAEVNAAISGSAIKPPGVK